jgi:hypothetical protein
MVYSRSWFPVFPLASIKSTEAWIYQYVISVWPCAGNLVFRISMYNFPFSFHYLYNLLKIYKTAHCHIQRQDTRIQICFLPCSLPNTVCFYPLVLRYLLQSMICWRGWKNLNTEVKIKHLTDDWHQTLLYYAFVTRTDYTSICNSVQVYDGNRANYVKVKILSTFYKSQLSLQKFIGAVLSKIHPVSCSGQPQAPEDSL